MARKGSSRGKESIFLMSRFHAEAYQGVCSYILIGFGFAESRS